MIEKVRLSVSVDAALAAAAQDAVRAGRAASVSALVSAALRRQLEHDARLRAADEFIAGYESEHGEITEEEMEEVHRAMRLRATTVGGRPRSGAA